MINETIELPCGARLIAVQGSDRDSYMLLHLIADRPLDKFFKIDNEKNKITLAMDPDNIEVLSTLFQRARPKTKFERIIEILKEPLR